MKFLELFAVFVLLLIFVGCATVNQGKYIQLPDGSYVYKLAASKDNNHYCKGAAKYARRVADECRYIEKKKDGQSIAKDCGAKSSIDLYNDMYDLSTESDRDKRTFAKIVLLFNRIVVEKEFSDKSLDEIKENIFQECVHKMEQGTWFEETSFR